MAPRVKVTVQPHKGGGWDVVTPTGVKHHQTKDPALDQGRQIAKAVPAPSQLIVKGQDGKIQTEHTYPRSSDPKKYPG